MVDFELIIKYFLGKASPEEAICVEDFAEASPEQYAYFKSLHESWIRAGAENYQLPDIHKEWNAVIGQKRAGDKNARKIRKRHFFKRVGIAATLIFLIGMSGYFLWAPKNSLKEMIVISAGKPKSVLLEDGTHIRLRPPATLHYPSAFKKQFREVKLKGGATFGVMHNPLRPFIIYLDHELIVKVTGTIFHIDQRPESVQVRVDEGSVLFYRKSDTLKIVAGNMGKYIIAQDRFVLLPLTGSFDFKDASMEEVAMQLSRHFHVNIRLQNSSLNNCRLSAVFHDQSLLEIVDAVTATFDLSYKIENKNIYINGAACE